MAAARNSRTKPGKKKGSRRKAASPAKSKKPASKRARITQKTIKPILNRTSAVVESVRARFTEPLRRSGEYENIRALIAGQAEKFGAQPFLIEEDGAQISFADLEEQTSRVANLLQQHGAQTGSRVAIALPSSTTFAVSLLGVMKAGCVAVPLGQDSPVEELAACVKDCGASHLIAEGDVCRGLASKYDGFSAVFAVNGAADGAIDFVQGMKASGAEQPSWPPPRWWDEAEIAYSAGTGAEPRGAVLQQRQFLTAARRLAVWLGLGAEQRVYNATPLFQPQAQVAALFMPLLAGGTAVIARRFDAARVWRAVERHRVTTLSAASAMLEALTAQELANVAQTGVLKPWPAADESPGALAGRDDEQSRERGLASACDISSVRRAICYGLPAEAQLAFEKCFLVPVIGGYSLPETTGFAALNPGNGTRKIGTAGVPVGNKIAVQDDSHAPKPLEDWDPQGLLRMSPTVFPTAEIDEPGEICVWGEIVLREYHSKPELNPKAFAGGWFHTGRSGRLDRDGYLHVDKEDGR